MLKALRRGEILVGWRLDRLGRSISHLISMVESLKRRGIGFVSLTESIDTSSAGGQLIFHILAALAEFEKSLIRERTIAGPAAAKARGKLLGRRPALTEVQCMEIRSVLNAGACVKEVGQKYNVHPRTVLRGIRRLA
jgi:DNA invertase Pin-like site-specific DNA recombinase